MWGVSAETSLGEIVGAQAWLTGGDSVRRPDSGIKRALFRMNRN